VTVNFGKDCLFALQLTVAPAPVHCHVVVFPGAGNDGLAGETVPLSQKVPEGHDVLLAG
jgi:hypothetical protein